jgi:cellulose synthase/poly-beta-1,6-N-acetylglucosamine synthase-like glycosyltransferase
MVADGICGNSVERGIGNCPKADVSRNQSARRRFGRVMLRVLEPGGQTEKTIFDRRGDGQITVIVPAYNEAASVADTISSLLVQTLSPARILVVDDGSTDGTGDVARALGVRVLRPPKNTGSKAGAQTYALPFVETEFTIAIDADSILAPDAIQNLFEAVRNSDVAAASGYVLPRYVKSLWERGRYIEYLFAFSFFKPIQDHFGRPLISSGCFSIYRTDVLRELGGWSNRTLAEDMDLTWTLYATGRKVRFVPEANCFPIEPHDFKFLRCQLRRWSHGFNQNVLLHWRHVLEQPYLRAMVAVMLWDAIVTGSLILFALPLLSFLINPLFLLGYIIDLPIIAVPVLVEGLKRRELGRVFLSLPAYPVLRIVNTAIMLQAIWLEIVRKQSLRVYEKGH